MARKKVIELDAEERDERITDRAELVAQERARTRSQQAAADFAAARVDAGGTVTLYSVVIGSVERKIRHHGRTGGVFWMAYLPDGTLASNERKLSRDEAVRALLRFRTWKGLESPRPEDAVARHFTPATEGAPDRDEKSKQVVADFKAARVGRDGNVTLRGVVIGSLDKSVSQSSTTKHGPFGYVGRPRTTRWHARLPDGTTVSSSASSQRNALRELLRHLRWKGQLPPLTQPGVTESTFKKTAPAGTQRAISWKCVSCGHEMVVAGDRPKKCSKCGETGWVPTVVDVKTSFGRVGTAAELYKRLIMAGLSNDQAHARVAAELGAKAAGPASYPGWYRNWLVKHGFTPKG